MSERCELFVLGAGPAGMAAATAAASRGVDTVIVDAQLRPGGQVYRALPESFEALGKAGPDQAAGDRLRDALAMSGARGLYGARVWSVKPGFRLDLALAEGGKTLQAETLLLATGTHEKVVPVPGWTRPGVIGLAAATVLLKADGLLPGGNTVVAGVGPLVAAVAAGIIQGGGRVAAVVDLSSRSEWLARLPALAGRLDLLARGLAWLRVIRAAGVPIYWRHAVTAVGGGQAVEEVELRSVDRAWRPRGGVRRIAADSLALGHGLVPNIAVSRLLGAAHVFDPDLGGWVARSDADGRTSLPGLYLAGDAGGIRGAAAAELAGGLVGLAVARDLGRVTADDYARTAAPLLAAHRRAARFGTAMGALMAFRPGLLETVTGQTLVCRCEEVTRSTLEEAVAAGAGDLNQLKSWTRCGMGPCQGRFCGETVAELLARGRPGGQAVGREAVGHWTPRVPLLPVPLETVVGGFDYADIPQPQPAPA